MATRTKAISKKIDVNIVETTAVEKIIPILITGYQYGDYGNFIGEYQFEKNRDKEEIHCPPRTTLIPPPTDLPADKETVFDGEKWIIRNLEMPWLPDREIPADDEVSDGN
ncbi:hypothetical protein [Solimicrobium silvestre]|uniref:Uncharacterized protein n=1 Tax=Solimicrobium silvestre TaxID=2099400 RepID=A0A2S9GTG2_9BURK|nr:hypothetical protein [Solimicrobium silvestre]PRC90978.1 hypothetical protein S2091_4274 [Solimicrobium silvestre]